MSTMKDFFARFFSRDKELSEHHYVFTASSEAKAKWGAKRIATEKGWRLVNVDRIEPSQKEDFRSAYQNHITVTFEAPAPRAA